MLFLWDLHYSTSCGSEQAHCDIHIKRLPRLSRLEDSVGSTAGAEYTQPCLKSMHIQRLLYAVIAVPVCATIKL
jgi:hypothetical protein